MCKCLTYLQILIGERTRITVFLVIGIESARREAVAFLFGDIQGTRFRVALRILVEQKEGAILASWRRPPIFRFINTNLLATLTSDIE